MRYFSRNAPMTFSAIWYPRSHYRPYVVGTGKVSLLTLGVGTTLEPLGGVPCFYCSSFYLHYLRCFRFIRQSESLNQGRISWAHTQPLWLDMCKIACLVLSLCYYSSDITARLHLCMATCSTLVK